MKTFSLLKPFILLSLFMLASLHSADTPAQTPLPTVAFEKTTLSNGLQLILVEDRRLPIVAVNIWYHVGPANEAPGLRGFAHLFEHMMFSATRHIPRGLADQLLEGAGATDSNGSTDYDRTNYYDTVPSNQLELALWVHADRMGYLLDVLDQKALTNQQDVVRNERRQTVEGEPYGVVEEALAHAMFPKDHPYYSPIIGSHADIQAAKLEDVRQFFARYYGPNNASIVIAGDIDKARTRALVERYFGGLRRSEPVARPSVATPPITSERRVVVHDRVELPRIYIGWLTPKAYQPGDIELAVAAEILGGGKSSRLYKKLVYERQIAQEVDAAQNSYGITSTFVIDVIARNGVDVRTLEAAIDAELAELREHGPSQREVERARNSLETALLSSIEKLGGDGLADQLNHYNQYTGDPGYLGKDIEQLRRVSPQDVQRVVRAYLARSSRAVVTGLPMVTIVRSGNSWVEANYKETQLTKMVPGQPAEIRLDAYPGAKITGHVLSIGRGTGSEFSVLPAQNATGNWVKVTQRVPVRIAIDGNPGRPLLAGLSAHVKIDTLEQPEASAAAAGGQLAGRR